MPTWNEYSNLLGAGFPIWFKKTIDVDQFEWEKSITYSQGWESSNVVACLDQMSSLLTLFSLLGGLQ